MASSFSCFLSASVFLSGGLSRARILCPDIGRGCRIKPYIESVIVPNKSLAIVSTFGKHFPFGFRNAAQMEDRDNKGDLRKENSIASDSEEEGDAEFGGDVTLLPGSDDLLRRCDPCLSRFVSNRCMVFVALRYVADPALSVICVEFQPQKAVRLNMIGESVVPTLKAEQISSPRPLSLALLGGHSHESRTAYEVFKRRISFLPSKCAHAMELIPQCRQAAPL